MKRIAAPVITTVTTVLGAILASVSAHAADAKPDTWILRGTKVYVAPDVAPIVDGVVVIRDGRILSVGNKNISIPPDARESKCSGGVITAGFQNSHVHFIGDAWNDAGRKPAADLSRSLAVMLTRYGYATVFDIASDRDNTLALRARIERGDVRGPRILTVGLPLFPPDGLPIYLDHFPREFLDRMPQPATVEAALKIVRENLAAGTDATKLFLATPQAKGVKRMSADIARAAVEETHRQGKLVFAHPTDIDGVKAAVAAGVDILAHTTLGVEAPWPDELQKQAIRQGMSVIPTLQLMGYELKKEDVPAAVTQHLIATSVEHVKRYAAAGGQILFGTDVGYMSETDPTEEYRLLSKAGLTNMQILASLTTTPASRWKESNRRGRVAEKMDADLVVLDADPSLDPANFSKVACTVSRGKTIYAAAGRE